MTLDDAKLYLLDWLVFRRHARTVIGPLQVIRRRVEAVPRSRKESLRRGIAANASLVAEDEIQGDKNKFNTSYVVEVLINQQQMQTLKQLI